MSADDAADPHAALERTVAELQSALDEASASEARDREFLAAAAHHLRTPVGSIHAGVEALLHGPCLEEREHLFADLVRQGSRAARLVDSLLRLARLDAGEPLRPGPCDLVQVCSQQVQWVRERAPHLELVLDAERPPRAPHLDQRAVCEILTQLLDRARRHAAGRSPSASRRAMTSGSWSATTGRGCPRPWSSGPSSASPAWTAWAGRGWAWPRAGARAAARWGSEVCEPGVRPAPAGSNGRRHRMR